MNENDETSNSERYWPALIALTLPVAFLIWQSLVEYGWLEMAFGQSALFFWLCIAIWLGALVLALRRRHWWALLAAPLAIYPIYMSAVLLAACASDNCL